MHQNNQNLMTADILPCTAELHAHVFMDGADYKNCVRMNKNHPDEGHIRKVFSAYKKKGIFFVREGGDHFGVCARAKEIAPEYGITYIMPAFAVYKEGCYGRVAGKPYSSLSEYRQLVYEAKANGADFIKLMLSGIVDFNRFGIVSESEYSLSEIKELVNTAHGEGFAVMAHVSGTDNILKALEGGIDSLEHGYYINNEGICALKESRCVWVPTAVTCANLKGKGRFDEKNVEMILDKHKENIALAFESGALTGCGSDAGAFGVCHGEGTVEEYALLCDIMKEEGPCRLKEAQEIIRCRFSPASQN